MMGIVVEMALRWRAFRKPREILKMEKRRRQRHSSRWGCREDEAQAMGTVKVMVGDVRKKVEGRAREVKGEVGGF